MKKILFYSFFALTILANSIDTFGYSASFEKYFHITSNTLLFIFVAIFLFLRIKKDFHLTSIISISSKLLFAILITTTIILSTVDFYTPINFVYAATRLNIDQIGYLAMLFGLTILIDSSNKFFQKNWKNLIFFAPVVILLTALMIRSWPFDYFLHLAKEDHLVENTQFFVLLTGSIFAVLSTKIFWERKEIILSVCFALMGIGLFLTSGDEISWGQRLLGIATPETISKVNVQGEITFHNISSFDALVPIGYISIGLILGITWMFSSQLSKIIPKKIIQYLIPKWYLTIYFLTCFIFNVYFLKVDHNIGEWSEIAELMLYSGLSLWIFIVFIQLKNPKREII